jgi:hypothetical protein
VGCFDCHGNEWQEDSDVLRDEYRLPLAGVFPLPAYDVLPPGPPYVDPQPVLADSKLYYYQVRTVGRISLVKTASSAAIYY